MAWSLLGALGMYCVEMMAMKVEGVKNYFSDAWNYIDTFTLISYFVFCAGLIMKYNYDKDKVPSDLENILKLLKCFILFASWVKLTWYQKLFKNLGLL